MRLLPVLNNPDLDGQDLDVVYEGQVNDGAASDDGFVLGSGKSQVLEDYPALSS